MWSGSGCATFMPQFIMHLLHQAGPLNAFDLYFCITSLFLLLSLLFLILLSITSLSFSDLFYRFWYVCSPPLVYVLFNRSSLPLLPPTISYFFAWHNFLFVSALCFVSLLSVIFQLFFPHVLFLIVYNPSLSTFCFSVPLSFLWSARPRQMRSVSTCRKWDCFTLGSL